MTLNFTGKVIVPSRIGREGKYDRDQLLDQIPVQDKTRMNDILTQKCIQ